jgi:hypothetical protein
MGRPKTKRSKGGTLLVALSFAVMAVACTSVFYNHQHEDVSVHPLLSRQTSTAGVRQGAAKQNPLFIPRDTQVSLHPKWKVWEEMTEAQQQVAMDEVGVYLRKYGALIMKEGIRGVIKHGECEMAPFGGKESHALCGPAPPEPCFFLSFGINDDPSFDIALADNWHCRGYAGDPTVEHPSKIHPLVTFHNVAATTLTSNEERLNNKGGESEWWETSMPRLKAFLGLEKIDILKLDCEGCEVAFGRDIIMEDPNFLHSVGQISLETHVTKTWLKSVEAVYYFGLHFALLLEEAGFVMEWSHIFGCSKRHEVEGCVPELEKYGFPCGYDEWRNHPNVVKGRSCHDFLWKRYPEKAQSPVAVLSQ